MGARRELTDNEQSFMEELMRDLVLPLLRDYSKLFYFVKHRLHARNLREFGFLSRLQDEMRS
jgi:hypothetical protein